MQTNNYEEARRYFNNNAQYGCKHIESFIVSEQMFERLLKKMISPEDPLFNLGNMQIQEHSRGPISVSKGIRLLYRVDMYYLLGLRISFTKMSSRKN